MRLSVTEASGNGPPWSAVVVLGAGRSGTSTITRAVAALGVDLGNRLRRGRGKNPTGFFEDRDLLALNKRLKRILGIRSSSVRLIEPEQWKAKPLRQLQQDAVETIRRRFGSSRLWGYKYGRTLRMLPFWQEVYEQLDLDVRYVLALRNPLSVARSRARLDPVRGTQEKSDLEWLVNVVPYLARVRSHRFVAVDYDLIMADPNGQLERMARALELPLTEEARAGIRDYNRDFLDPSIRHTRFTLEELERDGRVHPLVREGYRRLHRLAADESQPSDETLWTQWRSIEQAVASLAPLLCHIDRMEEQLLRSQRSPLGPLQSLPTLWRSLRGR